MWVSYQCKALAQLSPFMVIKASQGDFSVLITGLDGPGMATCKERGAVFDVPGYHVADDAPCTIEITERTGSTLYGVVNATLTDNASDQPVELSLDFSHERNILTPSLSIATPTDFCRSTSISHTTKTQSGVTIDVLRAEPPFDCSVSEQPLTEAVEIEIIRADHAQDPEG